MKKNLFLLTILFWFLATTYVSSQENVIIPLKKPTLNPELKEKKISINIIKPLEKPILVKEVKKKDEKEEIVENKKITKLGIIVPKNKPKLCSDMQKYSKSKSDNEIKEAERIDQILQPLHKSLFIESNPAPAKYAAKLLGLCNDEIRLPLVNIQKDTEEKVKKALISAKLIS